jgi:hypothetical protein
MVKYLLFLRNVINIYIGNIIFILKISSGSTSVTQCWFFYLPNSMAFTNKTKLLCNVPVGSLHFGASSFHNATTGYHSTSTTGSGTVGTSSGRALG